MVGDKCIAMATNCTFHISAQLEDSSIEGKSNDWKADSAKALKVMRSLA